MNTAPAARPSNPRIPAFTAGAVLVLLVLAVYLPSLGGGFVWDDLLLVQQNPLVTGELSLRSIWFSTDFPLSIVALWLEWLAFGQHAADYRIVNALLHAGSCLLLWRLLARLRIPGAWLAAALFAVHPVAVGSVAWISEIKNTLSLPFYLASFWFYLAGEQMCGDGQHDNIQGRPLDSSPSPTAKEWERGGERFHGPRKAAICAPEPEKTELGRDRVLECASPLALWKSWVVESARRLAHSKTLRWCVRVMGRAVHSGKASALSWLRTHLLSPALSSIRWRRGGSVAGDPGHGLNASAQGWPARLGYLLSLGAFLLALLSKTSTVMLPVVLLGCAWWQRGRITRQDWLRTAPHFALALAFSLMTVWFQTRLTLAGFTLPPESFGSRVAGAGLAAWFYLGKALLPLQLNAIYPRWAIDPHSAATYLPVLLLVGLAAVCWWFRRSWGRHALFALGCFAVNLFPALGFFDMYFLVFSRVSDHFQYLALIAPLALVAAGLSSVRGKIIPRVLGVLLITGLGLLAAQRAKIFATDEALWRDTLAKNPAAWNAHNNLGCILAERNDLAGATEQFVASLKLNPRNASAHCNLGRALLLKNNFPEAETQFRTALEIKPDHVDTLKAYGGALAERGRKMDAVKLLREALRLKPDPDTRLQLAPLLSALGKDAEAVAKLRAILATQPNSPAALQNLAWILATSPDEKIRNGKEAVRFAERACALTSRKEARMLGALAAALAEAGRFAEAATTAQQTIELAQATGDDGFARINAQLLRLYQHGRSYHSPPAPPEH